MTDDIVDTMLLECRAKAGDAVAQTELGIMYLSGKGVRQDLRRGKYWLRLGCLQDDTRALRCLQWYVLCGKYGFKQDESYALRIANRQVKVLRDRAASGDESSAEALELIREYGKSRGFIKKSS